jgi:hypothetical protein
MEAFFGKWKMESSDNFEEYLKALGVGMATRKMAASSKPNNIISAEANGVFNIRSESSFKNIDTRFKLDEEFDETTADGRKVKTTVRLEGRKLIQEQKGDIGTTLTRELTDDNTLVLTLFAEGVTATRVFKRA